MTNETSGAARVDDAPAHTSGVTVSRRSIVNMLVNSSAAIATATATAVPAAPPTAKADPIFAAIERHDRAVKEFNAAVKAWSAAEQTIPAERRRSTINFPEMNIVEGDDPRWIEAEQRWYDTCTAMDDPGSDLLDTEPTTLQGTTALLAYIVDLADTYPGEMMGFDSAYLQDGVDPDTAKWADERNTEYFIMKRALAALRRLNGEKIAA